FRQSAAVDPEEFHEPAQGRLDLRIDLAGRQVDKGRRQLRQQALETQTLLGERSQRATSFCEDVAQVRREREPLRPTRERAADTSARAQSGWNRAGRLILGG